VHDGLERGAFPAQFLGAVRVVPDAGFRQFQLYLGQSLLAMIEVKGTP
jgi:hypothetical protein